MDPPGSERALSNGQTAAVIFVLGFAVSLAGDACHVASGTTRYEWSGVPAIWRSDVWFPFLVATAVLGAAWSGRAAGLPAARTRTRTDVVMGAAAVLALYAITAALRGEPTTVSVLLTAALAVAIWAWWDPSPGTLAIAAGTAVAGPLVEIGIVAIDAASYAGDSDDLGGVAAWLPCLYFAAGSVAAGLWRAVGRD